MRTVLTKLGLLSTTAAIVWLVLPGTANASAQATPAAHDAPASMLARVSG